MTADKFTAWREAFAEAEAGNVEWLADKVGLEGVPPGVIAMRLRKLLFILESQRAGRKSTKTERGWTEFNERCAKAVLGYRRREAEGMEESKNLRQALSEAPEDLSAKRFRLMLARRVKGVTEILDVMQAHASSVSSRTAGSSD